MSQIFFIMGKSSSGKDTLYKKIKQKMPDLKEVVGYTTRPRRDCELDGKEYFFVDVNQMEKLQLQGKIIEKRTYHTVYGDWHYFTVDDRQIQNGRQDYLMLGTLDSYRMMRNYYGKERLIPIYIEVEDGLRLQRALNRELTQDNPKYAEMCRRFLADEEDFSEKRIAECEIEKRFVNDDLNRCLEEICTYITEKIDVTIENECNHEMKLSHLE